MTTFVPTANQSLSVKFRNFFKPRDIFLHDGKSLRRFTIGARLQMAVVSGIVALLIWSLVATIAAINAMSGDVARMQQQVAQMQSDVDAMRVAVRERATQLEQRTAFLDTMLTGEATATRLSQQLPRNVETPDNARAAAMVEGFGRADAMQLALAERLETMTRQRYNARAAELRRRGFDPARFQAYTGQGGPYEAAAAADDADPRFRQLFTTWRALDQLETGAASIPSARPINLSVNFTSGYGVRSDPFRGSAAMHAGIDLAGPLGTPIYATADGIVGRSEWNSGGYGNLVELNHGQGIQTRYGHLSQRIVQAGQRVRRGQLIGLMGSTGRSTGSHLHYEVRIDGRAVNPIPFMQQPASTMAALQRPAAIGGPAAPGGAAAGSR
ncbi:MAG TPA: M23 family metallopeptidase [Allosphingosinicella sp.]|nr:M23 family metallopeptidase [Allosphingosinicella sp.]